MIKLSKEEKKILWEKIVPIFKQLLENSKKFERIMRKLIRLDYQRSLEADEKLKKERPPEADAW